MKNKFYIGLGFLFFLALVVSVFTKQPETAFGSAALAASYNATTTSGQLSIPAQISLLKGGPGEFGSVIVTGAGAAGGGFYFYNATTSNVNLRTNNTATTSLLIASIPNNVTVGTYTFDVVFSNGLLMEYTGVGATVATTTITTR